MSSRAFMRPKPEPTPPLEPGDRLTRDEFERRYEAMPDLKKAELIEGVVYMPSPVRHRGHSSPHSHLVGLTFVYAANTPGVESGDNGSIRLDLDNEPQPDAYLFIDAALGGQAVVDEEDYVVGAPEWVGEVSSSTVSLDLHGKLKVYRRTGVKEYVVWRVLDEEIDWFRLQGSEFVKLNPSPDGIHRSAVLPGFWIDSAALIGGNLPRVLEVLQQGLASPEHGAFVAKLQQARK